MNIKNWPRSDRPREKLLRDGEHTLSDTELIAILLRTGIKGRSAIDLAREILDKFSTFRGMSHTDFADWRLIKGLGPAKIAQLKAAIEIGRRFAEEETKKTRIQIRSSKTAADLLMPRLRDLKKEVFKIMFLNSRNQVLDICEVSQGTVDRAHPIIREVFQESLRKFSCSIICLHNHPSGNPAPSQEDKEFTSQLAKAGAALEIKVLDHIIIGDNRYFSFADENLI
jgi:DNA repair protein RadC